MTKGTKDAIGSIGIFSLAAIYLGEAVKLPLGNAQAPDIGYVPVVVAGLLMILSGYSFVRAVPAWRKASPGGEEKPSVKGNYAGVAAVTGALLLYPLPFASIGFLLPSAILTFICLRVMSYRTAAASAVAAVLINVVLYVVFSVWLGVSFPDEIWR